MLTCCCCWYLQCLGAGLRAAKGQLCYLLLWLEVCSSAPLPRVSPTVSVVDEHSLCGGAAWEQPAVNRCPFPFQGISETC